MRRLGGRVRELHLFSGIGGGILGGILLGHTCVCAVEIEPYCRKVLLQRQRDGILPRFPIWDDVCTFDGKPWRGLVDVICAGFPCKGVSPARTNNDINGKLVGINGASSELWSHIPRIAVECGHPNLFVENSSHLVTRGLCVIVQALDAIGYECKWIVLGAGHIGADHERKRLWLKATHPNGPQRQGGKLPSRARKEYKNIGCSNWWKNKPRLERVEDGVSGQMDRLKAIGNGQVPAVAALAWKILSNDA